MLRPLMPKTRTIKGEINCAIAAHLLFQQSQPLGISPFYRLRGEPRCGCGPLKNSTKEVAVRTLLPGVYVNKLTDARNSLKATLAEFYLQNDGDPLNR